jgi:putative solute:sodium symporter small subunit
MTNKNDSTDIDNKHEYWRANISLMQKLLLVWFVVSYGCGVLLVDVLNTISLGGFKLGFWFAQQGAIYTFVIIIFIYVAKMNQLDRKFGLEEE